MQNFDFLSIFFTIEVDIIKSAILFSVSAYYEEPWRASCPLRKVTKASLFFFFHMLNSQILAT